MILSPDELIVLTKRIRSDGQRRELEHLGIPYKVRRDGSVVVFKADSGKIDRPEPELHL
jgi:hypothetical protein